MALCYTITTNTYSAQYENTILRDPYTHVRAVNVYIVIVLPAYYSGRALMFKSFAQKQKLLRGLSNRVQVGLSFI